MNLPSTPRADALDFACGIAQGATTEHAALSALTSHFFHNMGFRYDTSRGEYFYWDGTKFYASDYIAKRHDKVNCVDQAYAVVTFGNLLGACATPVVTQLFGFINTQNLVGVGACNNPFYEGALYEPRLVTTNGVPTIQNLPVPRTPICNADYVGRSFFISHTYVIANGVIFDACVGPALGTQTHAGYLNSVIDHSTPDEEFHGYFSSEHPGSSSERTRNFPTE